MNRLCGVPGTAPAVTSIRWTNEAILRAGLADRGERKILFDRLDAVAAFAQMYPRRRRGRFAGQRYFALDQRWLVYYQPSDQRDVLVFAIVLALARPR